MNASTTCPRDTAWCTQHLADAEQCVSRPIVISDSCGAWILQELPGVEPLIVVDTTGQFTLTEADRLSAAVTRLSQSIREDKPVAS